MKFKFGLKQLFQPTPKEIKVMFMVYLAISASATALMNYAAEVQDLIPVKYCHLTNAVFVFLTPMITGVAAAFGHKLPASNNSAD